MVNLETSIQYTHCMLLVSDEIMGKWNNDVVGDINNAWINTVIMFLNT
jgi:hypothetical protein